MFDILIIIVFLSVRLVIADMICMGLLLLLFTFIYTENLAIMYQYTHPAVLSNDIIGNMYVKSINLALVIAAFFLFQLCFMLYFSKELKKLTGPEELPHRQEGDIF
jgi:hypothetical protein